MKMHVFFKTIILAVFCGCFPAFAQTEVSPFEERLRKDSDSESEEAARIVGDIENYGADVLLKFDREKPAVKAQSPIVGEGIKPLPYVADQHWWWTLLKERKLNLKDTTVIYPKFVKFCVDVYNWGDRFFNTFDPEYVIGTGKRWKVRLVSDNWLDTYALRLPQGINSTMSSNVYSNIGAYIQYMAVSVGSSYDVEKLFKKHEPSHKKYEFGFICALFNAELYYHENRGGVNIRKFGDINDGKLIK